MKTKRIILCLLLSLPAWGAASHSRSGMMFEVGKPQKLLYDYQQTFTEGAQGKAIQTTFSLPDGRVAVVEEVLFAPNGKHVVRYLVDRKLERKVHKVEVKGSKAMFTTQNLKDGDSDTNEEDWSDATLVFPQLHSYVESNWATLRKGKTLNFDLALLEEMSTYGFTMSQDSETTFRGKKSGRDQS